jgi:S-adenosylmethionine synthetase
VNRDGFASDFAFTSECVTAGHPDKVCDQISDAILDEALRLDPEPRSVRVAVEALVKTGLCVVAGEMRTKAAVNVARIVRKTVSEIGYDSSDVGFDGNTCGVLVAIESQAEEIAGGVDASAHHEQGAGDQGLMFGFACDDTPELMPLPISLARRLTEKLSAVRQEACSFLRPDGKAQVTVKYERGVPAYIDAVVVSSQHAPSISLDDVRAALRKHVIEPVLPPSLVRESTRFFINPAGTFIVGGPVADAGVTGRKIIVDTYGGMGRHGGGAFSGKDASKVDRSAAYLARYIAKNTVAAGLAKRCEVQLSYAIGVADPIGIFVETFGTETVDPKRISEVVRELFPLKPAAITEAFSLYEPRFLSLARHGHFGRSDVPWERNDKAAALKQAFASTSTKEAR